MSDALKKRIKKIAAMLLSILLVFGMIPGERAFSATHTILEDLPVRIAGKDAGTVRTIHYEYRNNRFVSVRDMAAALSGTEKQFEVSVSNGKIDILTGKDYRASGGEGTPFFPKEEAPEDGEGEPAEDGTAPVPSEEPLTYSTEKLTVNPVTVNGNERRYYTFLGRNAENIPDAFISPTDLAMILDTDLSIRDGVLFCSGTEDLHIDLDELRREGLYNEISSAIVGEAESGTVFSAYHENVSVPCASTTKLMTFLCVMDAVSSGEIGLNDTVTFSDRAEALSNTQDGVIRVKAGQTVSVNDLIYGMLLPSSNECALALAEYIAGSEEEFVVRMNRRASSIGMSEATVFLNCHGLPMYSDNMATSKIQNHLSAKDMFLLSSYLLKTYPQVKEYTATKEYRSEALQTTLTNVNPVLYNVEGAVGLKTGTTKASGASLVSACEVEKEDGVHTIIAVEYGAEDGSVRVTLSELLLRYGIRCVKEGKVRDNESTAKKEPPSDPEELIRRLIRNLS
ncbi:MAG: serine hydrolase [Lachnospiraceae bacterium]|nr:serine hydrolase [Lachnospiraceae bacterium]